MPFEVGKYSQEYLDTQDGELYRLGRKNGVCAFLDYNDRCMVYDLRPIECKLYPWILYWDGDKLDVKLHDGCPQRSMATAKPVLDNRLYGVSSEFWNRFNKELV